MKISVIIPTYKDIVSLGLILNALNNQSYKAFDIIVAEDNNSIEVKEFLERYISKQKIYHFYQRDRGNRKAVILNKVLSKINSDYIIFIDGDTIPFKDFVKHHISLSAKKTILCGRRVNLSNEVSQDLRNNRINSFKLEKYFFRYFKYMKKTNSRHIEQGFVFSPHSLFYKFLQKINSNIHIVGSNFSCYKQSLDDINGFDLDIIGGMKDDVDLEWRFIMNGCKLESCKYTANLFHLFHHRESREKDENIAKEQMQINKNNYRFICTNGIEKKEKDVN